MPTVESYQKDGDKRKQAYEYFIRKGYSPEASAGIVGNLVHESGLNTTIEGDVGYKGGSSFGTAQWRGERLKKLKSKYGKGWTDFDNQLEFVDWELKNTHKNAGEKLTTANTVHEAGQIFSDFYEIPKKKYHENEQRRLAVQRVASDFLGEQEYQNINPQQTNFDKSEPFNNFGYGITSHSKLGANLPEVDKETPKKEESTSKEKEALLQKQKEDKFLQEYLSGDVERELKERREEQLRAQQQAQQEQQPQFDAMQAYEEVSQFVDNPIMQQGGTMVSKNGVFDSKGKPVIVPSGDITMKGVPYPILGISKETGERKMMLPNVENYFFKDTKNVLEIPMMQEGGYGGRPINERVSESTRVARPSFKQPVLSKFKKQTTSPEEEEIIINPLNYNNLDEVVITASKEGIKRRRYLEEAEKIDTNYKDEKEIVGITMPKQEDKIIETQKFLIDKGYDLNPEGRFKNDGVDGINGKVTREAIAKYNSSIQDQNPYKPKKEGEGFLGNCTETQCSEYVQNEIYRNTDTDKERSEWNRELGITGDAWDIGRNILNKGGVEVPEDLKRPGDVVTIYTGGRSEYQDQADKAGSGTTHTAVIDKVNPDGSYYILHNVHEGDGTDEKGNKKYKGREYRDLVKSDRIEGARSWGQIKNIYRPNYKNEVVEKVNVKEGIKIDSPKNLNLDKKFIKPLEDAEFKKDFVNREKIDEDEFYSLSKAALGIMGQETKFGKDLSYNTGAKRVGATVAKILGAKEDEVSLGPGSMKLETNFNLADIGMYGINKDNITEPENAVKAAMTKLTRDYKNLLKKGYTKKEAIYRAIQKYNGGLSTKSNGKTREEWAQDYDLDYVNKVINIGNNFKIKGKDKKFFTTFDEISTEENVLKWNDYIEKELF